MCCFIMQTLSGDTSTEGDPIYSFDGGEDSFVGLPQSLNFQPSQGFTVSGWVQQSPDNEG